MKYKYLPEVYKDKVISRNFGSISHLLGSKLIDDEDKLLSKEEQVKYTQCKRDKNDLVIITEKLDGMNTGVVKKNGLLYPINKRGYDTRSMGEQNQELKLLGEEWARWVDYHYNLYNLLIEEDERLVFENCIIKHTLEYKFKSDPVFLLAKYDKYNKRMNYSSLCRLAKNNGIQLPPLLNIGVALPPDIILKQYPKGMSGVVGKIEGIVYSYEHNGVHESSAKFVSNPIMGTSKVMPKFRNKFKYYIEEI